jgi:20S proteasome alpha/beta subunit
MTVIAGASLFSGVMLVADSRITVHRAGRPDVHADICQKIFPFTKSLAIGFAGDISAAAFILTELRAQLAKRERRDVVSLVLRWLPRFLKARYARYGENRPVHFMIAAVRHDQLNVIERQKVVDIMKAIAAGNASIQRNFIPDVVMQMMLTPASATHVAIQGGKRYRKLATRSSRS